MPLRTIVFLRWFERYRLTANYNLLIFFRKYVTISKQKFLLKHGNITKV